MCANGRDGSDDYVPLREDGTLHGGDHHDERLNTHLPTDFIKQQRLHAHTSPQPHWRCTTHKHTHRIQL